MKNWALRDSRDVRSGGFSTLFGVEIDTIYAKGLKELQKTRS